MMRDPSTQVKKRARVPTKENLTSLSPLVHYHDLDDDHVPTTKSLKIHECSFVKCDVPGITAVATSRCGNYIAAARSNGDLELREKKFSWALSSLAYAQTGEQDESIMAIQFSNCNKYLFAARLNGFLHIYRISVQGLQEHVRINPSGGAIWDMDILRNVDHVYIALACDDGCVRFVTPDTSSLTSDEFSLPTDNVSYEVAASHRFRGRMLSVRWAPVSNLKDAFVACGDSEGTLRWLNMSTRQTQGSGSIPSTKRNKVMLWTLQFVQKGHVVVCGDSRGLATLWSSQTATMVQEIEIEGLLGSLWSSTVIRDEDDVETVLFGSAAGAIGGLKIKPKNISDEKAVPQRAVRLYVHDVRGLATLPGRKVISGSTDSRLSLFNERALRSGEKVKWLMSHNNMVGQRSVQFSNNQNLIISRREKTLEVWSVSDDRGYPSLRLQMNLRSLSSNIRACAISEDCSVIAVSGANSFHLYKIWDGDGSVHDSLSFGQVKPIAVSDKVQKCFSGAIDMAFSGNTLTAISRCGKKVLVLKSDIIQEYNVTDIGESCTSLISLATCLTKVAVADSISNIFSLELDHSKEVVSNGDWKLVRSIGKKPHIVTCMSFSKSCQKLAFALSNLSVSVTTYSNGNWTSTERIHKEWESVVISISFSTHEESVVVAGDSFCTISNPKKKSKENEESGKKRKRKYPVTLPYHDSIVGSKLCEPGNIIVVRRPWRQAQTLLPKAIPKKVYGT